MRTSIGLLVLCAACGGDGSALDPGAGDNPGEGTKTLQVSGSVTAQPRFVNARNDVDFETEISVRVTLGLQSVTGGTVTVESSSGLTTLLYNANENRWQARLPGYDEVYILDVESGPDNIHNVRVDGPDLHFFEAPTPGMNVDSTMPLLIKWHSSDTADTASLDAEEIDRIAIPDTGSYMLAPGALKAEKDQARTNDIDLTRSNIVIPAGAIGDSQFSVRVENRLEIVALPNPAL